MAKSGWAALRAAAALLVCAFAASAKPAYVEVDISAAGDIRPIAINDEGVIAALEAEVTPEAFLQFSVLYDSRRGQAIRTWPDGEFIRALSNNGNTAGSSRLGTAWFEDRAGNRIVTPLQQALGVNQAGVVAGFAGGFFVHAAVYSTADGTLTTIGPEGSQGTAYAINPSGQVTGGINGHAYLWSDGVLQYLGSLSATYDYSQGFAIDAAGRVAGNSAADDGVLHPFLYDSDGMHDLGMFPGCFYGEPAAMNDHGDVVGRIVCDSGWIPFLYTDGQLYDLNQLATPPEGGRYGAAFGINNAGSIVGLAETPAGERAYLLVRTGGGER